MTYLLTRIRLALWAVRKRPSPDFLGKLRSEGAMPGFLYNPRDDRFTNEIKRDAFLDFVSRVVS